MSAPFSFDGSFRRGWMTWRRNTAGSYIVPVNFYQYIHMSGTDPSQWKILKVNLPKQKKKPRASLNPSSTLQLVYHNQSFPTTQSFLEAFNNGTLIRHTEQSNPAADYSWTQRKRIGPARDLDHLPGPRSVSFAGLRFRVDRERQYVSWMGWGMYLGFGRDMGLSLWDVRFRGERIIYQVSGCCCWLRITNAKDLADICLPSFHLKKPFLNMVRPKSPWNCRYNMPIY